MKIQVNGIEINTQATTLKQLLEGRDIDYQAVATAVSNEFVPRSLYAEFLLKPEMKIEVVSPMQGG